jgi:hypothetical protein
VRSGFIELYLFIIRLFNINALLLAEEVDMQRTDIVFNLMKHYHVVLRDNAERSKLPLLIKPDPILEPNVCIELVYILFDC